MTRINFNSREEWLKIRHALHFMGVFGGSDAGALAGVSPWKSPYALWAECTGEVPEKTDDDYSPEARERMRQGQDLEDYVARRFAERAGKTVHRVNAILRDEEGHPHLFATIDRKVANEDAGLECKRMGDFSAMKMRGEIPAQYYAQCVTYMAATGYHTWYLAIMTSDNFRIHILTRDGELAHEKPEWADTVTIVDDGEFAALDAAAAAMHECVVTHTPPAVDGAESTTEAINAQYRQSSSDLPPVDLTPLEERLAERETLKAEIEERETRMAEIENALRVLMGEAEAGECDGWKVSWKTSARKSNDMDALKAHFGGSIPAEFQKTTTSRTLRITRRKR